MERKLAWEDYSKKDTKKVFDFAEGYRKFISACKTERECVNEFVTRAEKAGFLNLADAVKQGKKLKAGDRIYVNNMGKWLAMFVVGRESLENGMNI